MNLFIATGNAVFLRLLKMEGERGIGDALADERLDAPRLPIITHLAFYSGWLKAWAAFRLAKEVWSDDVTGTDAKAEFQKQMIFPIGEPNTAYAKY